MRFSLDYSQTFFDIQSAEASQRAACEQDFRHGLAATLEPMIPAVNADAADTLARELWQQMTAAERHYHTPVHVLSMLCWADRLAMPLSDAETLAVWFHDACWDTDAEAGVNENQSARWLTEQAERLGVEPCVAADAAAAIQTTAKHLDREVPAAHAKLLDLDLAGFASEPAVFAAHSQAVRAESALAATDEKAYIRLTIRFFEALLARERIYRSPAAAALEPAARRQLREEIQRLRQSLDAEESFDPAG